MCAERCGYILMSALALCIHVGMSACSARPFVHQYVASARLPVRLMIVYHCACDFIYRPSICQIFCPSVCMSVCMYVCMYVHMYLCREKRTSVCTVKIKIELWIDLDFRYLRFKKKLNVGFSLTFYILDFKNK